MGIMSPEFYAASTIRSDLVKIRETFLGLLQLLQLYWEGFWSEKEGSTGYCKNCKKVMRIRTGDRRKLRGGTERG